MEEESLPGCQSAIARGCYRVKVRTFGMVVPHYGGLELKRELITVMESVVLLWKASVGSGTWSLSCTTAESNWWQLVIWTQSVFCRAADCVPGVVVIRQRETQSARTAAHCSAGNHVPLDNFVILFFLTKLALYHYVNLVQCVLCPSVFDMSWEHVTQAIMKAL